MSLQVEGKLWKVWDAEKKSESFSTREFGLEIMSGKYPQLVKFQLTQDRCDIIDNYKVGDQIKVDFDLRGKEWNEKIISNLNAWKIELASSNTSAPIQTSAPAAEPQKPAPQDDDGLPF